MRREIQFLKVFDNHTMLTPPQCAVHLVMFKISIHLCWLRSENWTACLNGRKLNYIFQQSNTQLHLQQSKSNWHLFQILKFSGPSLLGMTSSTLQHYFLSGGLLWQMVIFISFTRKGKTAPSDSAPGPRDPNSSKPYQTEW